jgi:uncharacterized protein YndB with AHSA1/START domain
MSTITEVHTTQVYQLFIKASPEQIWDAITKPQFTAQYFYGQAIEVAGGRRTWRNASGEVVTDEPVIEAEPPRRLVHSWSSSYDPEMAAEPESRVTWEIEEQDSGYSLLTVVHDGLEDSPKTAASVSGPGWMMVLSGLKTLLETGKPLAG